MTVELDRRNSESPIVQVALPREEQTMIRAMRPAGELHLPLDPQTYAMYADRIADRYAALGTDWGTYVADLWRDAARDARNEAPVVIEPPPVDPPPLPAAPSAPPSVTVNPTIGAPSAFVAWTIPTSSGSAPIDGYRVLIRRVSDGVVVASAVVGTVTNWTTSADLPIQPLTAGVAAFNGVAPGYGPETISAPFTPNPFPTEPPATGRVEDTFDETNVPPSAPRNVTASTTGAPIPDPPSAPLNVVATTSDTPAATPPSAPLNVVATAET